MLSVFRKITLTGSFVFLFNKQTEINCKLMFGVFEVNHIIFYVRNCTITKQPSD